MSRRFIYTYKKASTASIYPLNLRVLVVGGGGGSTSELAGGGGGGGFIYNSGYTITGYTSTSVIVGDGGDGVNFVDADPTKRNGKNGQNSKFLTLEAVGGGGSAIYLYPSSSGASSGGNRYNGAIGAFVAGQGYNGNSGTTAKHWLAGGGGGAGESGRQATNTPERSGDGGSGRTCDIYDNTTRWYGGGGGGAGYGNSTNTIAAFRGEGGLGGGGFGQSFNGSPSFQAASGATNTGGGAGGGVGVSQGGFGCKGGSGVVIVRYTATTQLGTGGVVTQVGGDWVHFFGTTGSTTFTI